MASVSVKSNLIGGEWRDSADGRENRNPSNVADVIGLYASGNAGMVDEAVAAAQAALPAWSTSTPQQRFDILDRAGTEVLARRDELGRLLSREEGKILAEGCGEVARAGQILKFMAGEALRNPGDVLPSVRPGVKVEVTREPVGVVGIITPWNFPIAIPAWKIAPALAYGNTVVFKPAELVPGSAWELVDILHRAGLPHGVLNLVMGKGRDVGQAILDHRGIDAVSFTGSVATGRTAVATVAARGGKVQAEMGGKNPLVVMDDANLDIAVEAAVNGAFYSTGQRCTASSRLIVTKGIHDRFLAAMRERVSALRVGDALAKDTQIGPVVDERQLAQDLRYVEIGKEDGGKAETGGEPVKHDNEGYFMQPVLFSGTTNDMRINREEVFGPVASIIRVGDYEEALATANDTEFGLCAGIATTSLKHAEHFKRHSRAGMVMVNLPTAGVDYHVPFGGAKGSSYGQREQGTYAKEFYTTVKTAYTA
ncbi:aldehyde dehydrogenase family protein [Manganibacter manganicus]|uniref:Aldehyde dehydrogenase n=1 Tax=Manganibacter manganicus TaxID=1873176 RepID=A0A1V8RQS6_9HYPH|nr:aldehyde dehydrogenase family protein [Pseudaminobacter manganicus]OQM75560.1 aldehyde dehydrogenase [Pseudaminobacter manganicus]